MVKYNEKEGVMKDKKEKKNNQTWLWVSASLSLVIILICAYIAHKHRLTGWQARLFYDINNPDLGSKFTTFAKWITEGLGSGYPIALAILIPIAFKKYKLAWRFAATTGGALVLAEIIKKLVNEPRPVALLSGHLHLRAIETGPSFPSNHEAAATALALTLWFILPVKWRFVSVIWIVVVAWSRLFLGVHTPLDVVAGFACGLLAVCVVRLLPPKLSKPLRLDEE